MPKLRRREKRLMQESCLKLNSYKRNKKSNVPKKRKKNA